MRLPEAEDVDVDVERLREYSLNPAHDRGKHKARVFAAAMGFTMADAERLRDMILAAVSTHEAIQGETDKHGTRYTVDFGTAGLHGAVTIRTAWIVDAGETRPCLVSCYIKRK
jgi:hypothetical protein